MLLRTTALTLSLAVASTASAFDVSNMTDAEREAFGAEVRAYILENPRILMEAANALQAQQAAEQASADEGLVAANLEALTEDGHSWVGGNPEGDITIVEFIDYRCSFCRRAFPDVQELVATDDNVRIIVKEFPILGLQSDLASRFAIAAKIVGGDDAYKTAHDALMAFEGNVSDVSLSRLASELDLDGPAIAATMETTEVDDIIAKNFELARALQITGTPTFIIGDQVVRGFVPLEGMREIIEEERAES